MIADAFNATIIHRHDLNQGLCIIRVKPDTGRAAPFQPGQFCTLGLPQRQPSGETKLIRRAYSIASASHVTDHREFIITLVEQGRLTPQLFDVPEGGRVWMSDRCDGHFTLDKVPPGNNILMIATGTGVAPFMSMIRTAWAKASQQEAALPWKRCALIHGCRVESDLGYRQELEAAAGDESFSFVYLPTLTREPAGNGWDGLRGRVQMLLESDRFESLAGFPLDASQTHVLLCGNPEMIESVRKLLARLGFVAGDKKTPGNLHYERYW